MMYVPGCQISSKNIDLRNFYDKKIFWFWPKYIEKWIPGSTKPNRTLEQMKHSFLIGNQDIYFHKTTQVWN